MSRIKIPLPEKKDFSTEIKLRISDINYGGHMGNDAVLTIVHEARLRFLNHFHLSETNFYGQGLLMTDSAVVYKKQVFYGDKLTIDITVTEFSKYGFELVYLILNIDKKEVSRVKTGLVCYDYSKKEIVPLPNLFREKFC